MSIPEYLYVSKPYPLATVVKMIVKMKVFACCRYSKNCVHLNYSEHALIEMMEYCCACKCSH